MAGKRNDKARAEFARLYVADPKRNATEAYQKAFGCTAAAARRAANRLLNDVDMQLTIAGIERASMHEAAKEIAKDIVSEHQADMDAAALLAVATKAIIDIANGPGAYEVTYESDYKTGEWVPVKKVYKPSERRAAAEDLQRLYGQRQQAPIKIELVGGADELAD